MNYLIIGGTGTLGKELAKNLDGNVTILSRCELKQQEMKKNHNLFNYVLGDMRDRDSMISATRGIDCVFLTAALKHVDVLEDNPLESVKTNILGVQNVIDACLINDVKYCVFSTTDKAVKPINVYGASKMIAEKMVHQANKYNKTKFSVFRWGNVVGSRGSAIPMFIEKIKNSERIPLTDPDMTRFWIRIEDAAKFMINNFKYGSLIPKMKAYPVINLCDFIASKMNKTAKFEIVGLRKGEKIHEDMTETWNSKDAEKYNEEELNTLLEGFI